MVLAWKTFSPGRTRLVTIDDKQFGFMPGKGTMEWALRKKGLAEVLVQAVMSLYEGSRTKVRVGSETLEEFGVRVGVHQGSVLSPLIFADN